MPSRLYRYSGLWVTSELDLPEWEPFETQSAAAPDVSIRLTQAQDSAGTPGDYAFTIPETARYRVLNGSRIEISPLPGAGETEIRLFLLGSAWGALCYQRGMLILHASVLHLDELTLAFCGPSGSGKSSLAAALIQRGAQLVSDDLCSLDLRPEGAFVHPSTPRLKLWRGTLESLGISQEGLPRDHFRIDKFHLSQPSENTETLPLRLDGIYLLGWGEPSLQRLRGLPAVSRLVNEATYHPELLDALGCLGSHWQRCLTLAGLTPIHAWTRPQDWSPIAWPPGETRP